PYYPVAVEARHSGARATIDPDQNQSWLRRAMPVVLSHRVAFASFLVCTVIALVVQTITPRVLMSTIDNAIAPTVGRAALWPYIAALLGLAAARGVFNFVSRYYMFRTAYNIEYDFRTIVYEHFSRLSFGFYDRVQSGQLISRGDSDIRSVQMYLTFVGMTLVQCIMAVLAFAIMLTINVRLACAAMVTMPVVCLVGVQ